MPGMGQPGMAGGMNPPPRAGTAGNPVGGGPPGIVSAQEIIWRCWNFTIT